MSGKYIWLMLIMRLLKPYLLLFYIIMNMKLFIWNCQGARDKGFPQIVNDFVRMDNPSITILLERRICGAIADKAINSLSFGKTHKVEASGFSEGI